MAITKLLSSLVGQFQFRTRRQFKNLSIIFTKKFDVLMSYLISKHRRSVSLSVNVLRIIMFLDLTL
jgi:hypothetical protein